MPNGRLNKKQVVVASKVLDQLIARHGHIKPAHVVSAARPSSSPIHNLFTWDNTKAAAKWREEEARSLIRSIRVVRDDLPIEDQPITRRYLNVVASEDEGDFQGDAYLNIEDVMRDEAYSQQVLQAALDGLQQWKAKHDGLKEFFGIYAEIESVSRTLSARSKAKKQQRKAA
jgi:hypothetical protein